MRKTMTGVFGITIPGSKTPHVLTDTPVPTIVFIKKGAKVEPGKVYEFTPVETAFDPLFFEGAKYRIAYANDLQEVGVDEGIETSTPPRNDDDGLSITMVVSSVAGS